MVEAKGIGGISISFTIGVALAAALGAVPGLWSSASLVCVSVLLLVLAGGKADSSLSAYLLLFVLLGFFSFASHPYPSIPAGPSSLLASFESLVDSVPFADKRTAALLKALLVGDKSGIPSEIRSNFRLSGASHILALSGFHLGVIYAIVLRMLSISGRSRTAQFVRSFIIISFCSFYTFLTGANPSTVRALLFILLRETGKLDVSRKPDGGSVYCSALLIQLVLQPSVIKSVSFQLSYLAMCGILLIFPRLKEWYPDSGNVLADRYKPSKWIWNCIALTLSCQIFTAPLVWIRFHSFPGYFLLTNLIALPLTELLIVSAVLCLSLYPLGLCPDFLASAVNKISSTLLGALEIIACM